MRRREGVPAKKPELAEHRVAGVVTAKTPTVSDLEIRMMLLSRYPSEAILFSYFTLIRL